MKFSNLSFEIVLMIFEMFMTHDDPMVLVQVCKRWRKICQSLYVPLEKFNFSKVNYTGRKLYYLCKFKYKYFRGIKDTELYLRFPTTMAFDPSCTCSMKKISKCNIDNVVHDMADVLAYISFYCPNMKKMELNVFELYDSTLIKIAKFFSKLQCLIIKYTYYMGTEKNMNETIRHILFETPSKIRSIKLNYNSFKL